MNGFICKKDAENIVTITMDLEGPVNAMNDEFYKEFYNTIEGLEKEKDEISGVILTSAKKTFFAGGNLKALVKYKKKDLDSIFTRIDKLKSYMRRLELFGKPVVAAINGTALGGGLELCFMCHYRIAIDDPKLRLGLPEVTLGLLPGAGGIVRTIRMLGLEKGLPFPLQGTVMSSQKALAAGIVNELANNKEEMLAKARVWIKANPEAFQPWDKKDYKIPGGDIKDPQVQKTLKMMPGIIKKQTRGLMPAPEVILATAAKSLEVDFEKALHIETKKYLELCITPEVKNLVTTNFLELNKLKAGASRPGSIKKSKVKKLGIIGAGIMGQGIAYVSALAGIEVILKDITLNAAQKGKAYSEKLLSGHKKKALILALITPVADNKDLEGCDFIVETVKETQSPVKENTVFAFNTSNMPVGKLTKGDDKPENFIGIYFFSLADKMPLVEIIKGKNTSLVTLAKTFDYVQQIRKIPIIVNDSPGFFTSRVFETFIDEGEILLNQGFDPALIENLAYETGMPAGAMAVTDKTFFNPDVNIPQQDIKDRLIFRMILEALHCLEDGVLKTVREGNIGSIMGFGFPDHTGGVFQHINTYGIKKFVKRAMDLTRKYGGRFKPPEILMDKADKDELFMD